MTAAADQHLTALPPASQPPRALEPDPVDPWTGRAVHGGGWRGATTEIDRSPGSGWDPTPAAAAVADETAAASAAAHGSRSDVVATFLGRAGSVAADVGDVLIREGRRYDRAVVRRWPKYRWPIHAGTAIVAFIALAIPFGGSPSAQGHGPGSTQPPHTAPPVAVLDRLKVLDPPNGAAFDADHYLFRGTGPIGATVVQDVPLADDPQATIGPDGSWSLQVALGPGANKITLRLGTDRSTDVTWIVTSRLAVVTPTPEPTPVVRALAPVPGEAPKFGTITLKGHGNATEAFTIPDDAVAIAGITHKGKKAFTVSTLDASGSPTEDLVSVVGAYKGTRLFDVDTHSVALNIVADGDWSVTIKPVGLARAWDRAAPLTGKGSAVSRLPAPASAGTKLKVTSRGAGSILVVAYRQDGRATLVQKKGNYKATVAVPEGTVVLEIVTASGWTLAAA